MPTTNMNRIKRELYRENCSATKGFRCRTRLPTKIKISTVLLGISTKSYQMKPFNSMEITYNEKKIAIQKVRFGTNRTGSRTQSKYIEEK